MADNLVQDGKTITTATGTARVNGSLYAIEGSAASIVGVSAGTYAATDVPTFITEGVFDLTKTAAANSAFSPGQAVYCATGTAARVDLTTVETNRVFVGTAWETVTTTETTVKVKLNAGAGRT